MPNLFEQIISIFSGPHWLRLIVATLTYVLTVQVTRKYEIPFARGLRAIPLIFIVREIISLLVFSPSLIYMSDAIVLAVFFYWLESYSGKTRRTFAYVLVMMVTMVPLLVLYEMYPNVPLILLGANLHLVIFLLLFLFQLNDISVYNTQQAEFVILNRAVIFMVMIITRLLTMFDPDLNSVIAQYILIPATMLVPLLFLQRYDVYFYSQQVDNEEFNSQYLNSLFDFMQTIGTAMTERIEVKAVLEYVMQAIVQYTDADAGAVLLRDTEAETLELTCREGYFPPTYELPQIVATKLNAVEKYFDNNPIKMGQTIIGEAAATGRPIFVRNTVEDGRMKANIKDNTMFISSLIAIPLIVNNEVFGVVSVIQRTKRQLFSQIDYERCKVFVDYASLTLDSLYNASQLLEKQEIEREVNIAGDIQKKLLPGRMPKRIRKMVSAWSKPAKGVSGDYYDIITLNRAGKLGMIICDVAGKGVPASLIMVMIRTITHLVAGSTQDASKVVSWINRGIAGRIDIERFATLSYITFDPNTNVLEYSNAAHHPLVLLRAENGKIEKLDSKGLPIGLERDAKYERKSTTLNTGDAILLYTDGIVEAMNPMGVQYEDERLEKVFVDNSSKNSDEILAAIREDIDGFVGNARQHDDQTLIVMKA